MISSITIFVLISCQSAAFQPSSLMINEVKVGRQHISTTILNGASEEQMDFSSPSLLTAKLTKQEQILQEALNIQPESKTERNDRQSQSRQLQQTEQRQTKRRNIFIAMLSFLAAVTTYAYQFTHPITDVQLLYTMSQSSSPLTEIGHNGKPTVIDFWAPWCDNCKRSATTLSAIEKEYGDSVNFIMVNGDEANNWPLIERFRVDSIPHMALVNKDGYVETALIGPVPKSVLEADLNFLVENEKKTELPFSMFDAFQGNDEMRKVSF